MVLFCLFETFYHYTTISFRSRYCCSERHSLSSEGSSLSYYVHVVYHSHEGYFPENHDNLDKFRMFSPILFNTVPDQWVCYITSNVMRAATQRDYPNVDIRFIERRQLGRDVPRSSASKEKHPQQERFVDQREISDSKAKIFLKEFEKTSPVDRSSGDK